MTETDASKAEPSTERMDYQKVFVFAVLRVVPIAISFLVTWLIVRIFSQEEAGAYFYVFSMVGVISAITGLGLNQSLIRFLGASGIGEKTNKAISQAVIWVLTACIFITLCMFFGADFIVNVILTKPQLQPIIIGQILAVLGLAVTSLFANAFLGVSRAILALMFFGLVANTILVVSLYIYFSIFEENVDIVVASWMYSVSTLLSASIAAIVWFRQRGTLFVKVKFHNPELFSSALPLWVGEMVNLIIKHGGLLISGIYVTTSDIALLSVSLRIAECLFLIYIALALIVSPKYSRLWATGKRDELFRLSSLNMKFLLLVSSLGAITMFLLGDILLGFFGEKYLSAISLLAVLSIGQVFYVSTATGITVLNMTGHEKDMMYCSIISGSISLPLSFFLISNYAVQGAAIASSASLSILGGMSLVFARYRFGRWLF